jgi:hypothetical protein
MKTKLIFSLLASMFLILSACTSDDEFETMVLQPNSADGKDAFIEDYPEFNYTNLNFGTHVELSANAWTAQGIPLVVRGLIEFDLSAIPTNAVIEEAVLELYAVGNTNNGPGHSTLSGSNPFVVKRVTSPWDEMQVTWNTMPSTTDSNQVLAPASTQSLQDYSIDVTQFVTDMHNSTVQNYGFMIQLINEQYYRRILFASSDHADASKHPKLTIKYKKLLQNY